MAKKVSGLIHGDLSYRVMAAVFEVHNVLGCGFLERVYENALHLELKDQGLKVEQQKELKVDYKGSEVGRYCTDLLVNDCILLELKAVDKLTSTHESQVINYLNATGLALGILINFGRSRVEYKRFAL